MSTPDLALVGGRVRTLDPNRPQATAIAVADGMITGVVRCRSSPLPRSSSVNPEARGSLRSSTMQS